MTSEIRDCGSLHKYRTEIPNIILDIDLEPLELSFYIHIKRIAGDHGRCWASNKFLCEKTKISERKLRSIKKSLEEKGLIKISKKLKQDGSIEAMILEIIDLWPTNFDFYRFPNQNISRSNEVRRDMPEVRHTMPEGTAYHATKEEPYEEEPIKKREDVRAKVIPVSVLKERLPHVSTTEEEHLKLEKTLGVSVRDECYKILSDWKEDTPKTKWKKSDYRSILRWVVDSFKERKEKHGTEKNSLIENMEYAKSIELKFKKYTGPGKNKHQIEANHRYFALVFLGCQSPSFTLNYDVPDFKKKLDDVLKQYNLLQ
jgi:hypothetical protein